MFYYDYFECPLNYIYLIVSNEHLTNIFIGQDAPTKFNNFVKSFQVEPIRDESQSYIFKMQLEEYFERKRKIFTFKYKPYGSSFNIRIWDELARIPYGTVLTYGEIAEKVSQKQIARAVGAACRKNPIPIVIPCHRVIGKGNKLTGFNSGIENKITLLDIENYKGKLI